MIRPKLLFVPVNVYGCKRLFIMGRGKGDMTDRVHVFRDYDLVELYEFP